jgi:hypothetical protein
LRLTFEAEAGVHLLLGLGVLLELASVHSLEVASPLGLMLSAPHLHVIVEERLASTNLLPTSLLRGVVVRGTLPHEGGHLGLRLGRVLVAEDLLLLLDSVLHAVTAVLALGGEGMRRGLEGRRGSKPSSSLSLRMKFGTCCLESLPRIDSTRNGCT